MNLVTYKTSLPPKTTARLRAVMLFAAAFILLLVVAQLFTFEKFAARLIEATDMSGGVAHLAAMLIVSAEVFSLPFLLRMRLSSAFRAFSMACGWLTGLFWLSIAITENVRAKGVSALFGATLDVPVGLWSVCLAVALVVLLVWAAWGTGQLKRLLHK